MNHNIISLQIHDSDTYLIPGCRVKLGRFLTDRWIVKYGWYAWGGNRQVCGWFLVDTSDPDVIKPLQLDDLNDIYIIEN